MITSNEATSSSGIATLYVAGSGNAIATWELEGPVKVEDSSGRVAQFTTTDGKEVVLAGLGGHFCLVVN